MRHYATGMSSSPPSDTLRRDSSQKSVLQANFGGPPLWHPLEQPGDAVGVALKEPLAALRAWSVSPPEPGWWHWVVGVDPTGRVMLPAGAWWFVGAWGRVGLVTRGGPWC